MKYTFVIVTTSDGTMEAFIKNEWVKRTIPFTDDLLVRYDVECRFLAERNPDMTPAQVADFVLDAWFGAAETKT